MKDQNNQQENDRNQSKHLQSNVNLLRRVYIVLFGPVAHEPRLNSQDGIAKHQTANK